MYTTYVIEKSVLVSYWRRNTTFVKVFRAADWNPTTILVRTYNSMIVSVSFTIFMIWYTCTIAGKSNATCTLAQKIILFFAKHEFFNSIYIIRILVLSITKICFIQGLMFRKIDKIKILRCRVTFTRYRM